MEYLRLLPTFVKEFGAKGAAAIIAAYGCFLVAQKILGSMEKIIERRDRSLEEQHRLNAAFHVQMAQIMERVNANVQANSAELKAMRADSVEHATNLSRQFADIEKSFIRIEGRLS